MQSSTERYWWAAGLAGMLLVLISGCGPSGSSSGISQRDYQAIRALSTAYGQYLSEHRGNAPPDEESFRVYLESKNDQWQKMGVTVEKMLVSPHNGKPLVIATGEKPPMGSGGMPIYAYEQEPIDGKRLIITSRNMFSEMEESEFCRAVPDAS